MAYKKRGYVAAKIRANTARRNSFFDDGEQYEMSRRAFTDEMEEMWRGRDLPLDAEYRKLMEEMRRGRERKKAAEQRDVERWLAENRPVRDRPQAAGRTERQAAGGPQKPVVWWRTSPDQAWTPAYSWGKMEQAVAALFDYPIDSLYLYDEITAFRADKDRQPFDMIDLYDDDAYRVGRLFLTVDPRWAPRWA